MSCRVGAVALGLIAALGATSAHAETYRNREFGFAVDIPSGFVTCRASPEQHDTHITILLAGSVDDCGPDSEVPFMMAAANYNAAFYVNVEAVADEYCAREVGRRVAAPPGLVIKGTRTTSCRVDLDDGGIVVRVFAQGGRWRDPGNSPELRLPAIVYRLVLQTRPERFDADLARFRALLKTYRLFKPAM
jgi:hypothetical protein